MKDFSEILKNKNIMHIGSELDGGFARVIIPGTNNYAAVIYSNGGGWNHVSVSFKHRCPSWDEMCFIKQLFFNDDEMVIQYHPSKEDYVNNHPYCLHLWKPQNVDVPKPPTYMVGIK